MRPEQVRRLAPLLWEVDRSFARRARRELDPVEFPHRFHRPEDIEVAALLSACLAYGRVDLFRPKLAALFQAMGPSPADFAVDLAEGFEVRRHRRVFAGFAYRFNVPADLAVLLAGAGAQLRQHGTLQPTFNREEPLQVSLSSFARSLRSVPRGRIESALGPTRGLAHLLPEPLLGSTSKRLLMFLRWMVRGPDAVDFGLWKRLPPARLVIPLDTHIARMSKHLGLTSRNDLSWTTASEITDSLRQIEPLDPVRFDFALCHFGMSGSCPLRPAAVTCRACVLCGACRTGPRLTGRKVEKATPAG